MEKLFVTGVLDELRICFSCSYQVALKINTLNQNFHYRTLKVTFKIYAYFVSREIKVFRRFFLIKKVLCLSFVQKVAR